MRSRVCRSLPQDVPELAQGRGEEAGGGSSWRRDGAKGPPWRRGSARGSAEGSAMSPEVHARVGGGDVRASCWAPQDGSFFSLVLRLKRLSKPSEWRFNRGAGEDAIVRRRVAFRRGSFRRDMSDGLTAELFILLDSPDGPPHRSGAQVDRRLPAVRAFEAELKLAIQSPHS